jgi:hypothetical protein
MAQKAKKAPTANSRNPYKVSFAQAMNAFWLFSSVEGLGCFSHPTPTIPPFFCERWQNSDRALRPLRVYPPKARCVPIFTFQPGFGSDRSGARAQPQRVPFGKSTAGSGTSSLRIAGLATTCQANGGTTHRLSRAQSSPVCQPRVPVYRRMPTAGPQMALGRVGCIRMAPRYPEIELEAGIGQPYPTLSRMNCATCHAII